MAKDTPAPRKATAAAGNLTTIDIKGKPYVTVAERIRAVTSVDSPKDNKYVILSWYQFEIDNRLFLRCTVGIRSDKYVTATRTVGDITEVKEEEVMLEYSGTAQVQFSGGMVNSTSGYENAETSALGRALGFAGIGVLDGVASADEITIARKAYNPPAEQQRYNAPAKASPAAVAKVDAAKKLLVDIKESKGAEKASANQLQIMFATMKEKGYTDKATVNGILCNLANTKDLSTLTNAQAAGIIDRLRDITKSVLDTMFGEE
jgi:hypothetical protein